MGAAGSLALLLASTAVLRAIKAGAGPLHGGSPGPRQTGNAGRELRNKGLCGLGGGDVSLLFLIYKIAAVSGTSFPWLPYG
jgi:hypothetical protein